MGTDKGPHSWVKIALVSVSFLFVLISTISPLQIELLPKGGLVTLAILFFSISLWFTEIIPAAVTSMVVIVLFPLFHVIPFEEAAQGLGNEIIWLVISMLMMATAVKKTDLDRRLAFFILPLSKGNVKFILLQFILLAFLLTFIIPNAMGRLTVLLPIGLSIIHTFNEEVDHNFSKSIIFIITFVPYLSTFSLLTGAGGSIYAASLFDSMLGYEWSYLYWMLVMTPITVVLLLVFWLLLQWFFPITQMKRLALDAYILEEKKELGAITANEKKLILLYSLLILLWITKPIHHFPISMSAVLISTFLFIPGMGVITWKDARNDVNWGVPLLFAAGFTIAHSLQVSGVVEWLGTLVENNLKGVYKFLLPMVLMILFVLVRIVFTNFTAMVASLMPVALTFAAGSPFNPIWLGMICVIASSTSFLFPTQSIGNMTTYTLGYYSGKDMFRIGSILTCCIVALTLIAAFFYWPIVGVGIK